MPGGCVIGHRPIDLHVKALESLGAEVELSNGVVKVLEKIKRKFYFLGRRHGSTVTGTASTLMLAVLTPGKTILEGCACEPEISDLCKMLISMGGQIAGIGSHRLTIKGVSKLDGCRHRVIPDRIEAGTYLLAGAITKSEITLEGVETVT